MSWVDQVLVPGHEYVYLRDKIQAMAWCRQVNLNLLWMRPVVIEQGAIIQKLFHILNIKKVFGNDTFENTVTSSRCQCNEIFYITRAPCGVKNLAGTSPAIGKDFFSIFSNYNYLINPSQNRYHEVAIISPVGLDTHFWINKLGHQGLL